MALSNAERQAAWRARHRPETPAPKALCDDYVACQQRITDLEAEVHHLKTELARRPILGSFGAPRPAPKPSRSRTSASGRAG